MTPMSSTELRHILDVIGLSQNKLAAFVGVDPRTSRRWAADDLIVPKAVAMLLRYMAAHAIAPADFELPAIQPPRKSRKAA
jgi:DNA-binding transcriptional regulator YiaG